MNVSNQSGKTIYAYVSFYYALVFMALGAFSSYISLYYNKIQLDLFTIGLLTSAGSVIALFVQPLWGLAADRSASKNRILLVSLLLTSATVWLVPLAGTHFWLLLLATIVFGVAQCVVNPLSDTIALELANKSSFNFSRVRTAGSVGYAAMSAVAGWILDRNIDYMFPVFSAMTFAAFLFALGIPRVEGHQRKSKVKLKELFANRPLLLLYIYTFAMESTIGFFFTFHAVYSQNQGISTSLIGIGIMIGSISQFPFMIFFDRLYARFGIYNILLFSGLIHVVRWILYATVVTKFTVILCWVLHGGTFMLFYLCLAEYVNRHVQKELKASGQMMNSIMLSGGSRVFGGLAGGGYAALFGIGSGFAVCAAICTAAMMFFFAVVKKHLHLQPQQKQTGTDVAS
ncbi:MFS transporter [Paenibacillus piri]|uniref:MFS transporter n=1 Tax=Paenibacillus piri TaxID=2547395 RepID=A0A4R5KFW4_9BACL|nr:MFS transporter [Paenibacillus piri]TDF93197.1 MFS transporter [Paenibacillus piri]